MPTTRRKPGRSSTNPAELNRDRVIDEAVNLLQDAGLAGLSTRRLAERLGVQSPALYWHVRNKDELLQLVADAICARMLLPARSLGFRKRLEAIAHEYRRVLTSHRDAARLFAEQPPTGPHRMRLYDVAVGIFLDAGFPTAEAVVMATFYRHYLLGMIIEEVRKRWPEIADTPSPAFALGVELLQMGSTISDYPNLARAAKLLTKIQPDKLFSMGLKVILDGLEQRARKLER